MKLIFAVLFLFSTQALAHDFNCSRAEGGGTWSTTISSWPHTIFNHGFMKPCTDGVCTSCLPTPVINPRMVCGISLNMAKDCTTKTVGMDARSFSMEVTCAARDLHFMLMIDNGVGEAHCMSAGAVVKNFDLGSCSLKQIAAPEEMYCSN